MSRPAAAVRRVIKAYDVRGLVGEEIDEAFVADVGAAFARLLRSEGADAGRVAIGYDMRESSPTLAAAFAEGVTAQGLDVVRIGLASTDQLYFASGLLDCPGAMFTASHNPAAYNGIKLCRAGAKPVGEDTGLSIIRDELIAGVPAYDGPRGHDSRPDVLADYGDFLRSLVDLTELRAAAGRRRRRQRHGRSHRPGGARPDLRADRCCRCTSNSTAPSPTTRPIRWNRPTSSTCRSSSSTPAPTSVWPSTATPTAASSSTSSASRSRRRR